MRTLKQLFLFTSAFTISLHVSAQGTVRFNNRIAGIIVTHIYAPGPGGLSRSVNGANDTPTGTTDWSGFTAIGSISAGQYGASTTLAVLLAAPGANQPPENLIPASPSTTFRTGSAAGNVVAHTATLGNVLPDTAIATLAVAAWD